jgi:hypothetical protein
MSEDKAVIALRSYVADYSSEDGMFQPKHYAREFQRILAEIDSKPTPTRIEFRMMGPKLAFSIGNQCFTLDHEPDSDDEAEFMKRALCHALSGFAPDVKTSGADAQPARAPLTEEQIAHAFASVKWNAAPSSVWFEAGVRFAERAHRIGEAG